MDNTNQKIYNYLDDLIYDSIETQWWDINFSYCEISTNQYTKPFTSLQNLPYKGTLFEDIDFMKYKYKRKVFINATINSTIKQIGCKKPIYINPNDTDNDTDDDTDIENDYKNDYEKENILNKLNVKSKIIVKRKTIHKKCEHNKRKNECFSCGGVSICEHQRIKRKCKICI